MTTEAIVHSLDVTQNQFETAFAIYWARLRPAFMQLQPQSLARDAFIAGMIAGTVQSLALLRSEPFEFESEPPSPGTGNIL